MYDHIDTSIRGSLKDSVEVKVHLLDDEEILTTIASVAKEFVSVYERGNKLLIAGNGGSAADAQHFAAEITCDFKRRRKARPALALHTDTSALTAYANDHSFKEVYARLIEAHGVSGDALVVISTSGNSANLLCAAETAHDHGMKVFGLLGCGGGKLYGLSLCDKQVIVPSYETPRIQEVHITIIHALCEVLDEYFAQEDARKGI